MTTPELSTLAFLNDDARERLEWQALLNHLSQGATFADTKAALLALVPNLGHEERASVFLATGEMLKLISEGKAPTLRDVDFQSFMPILRRSGTVPARALYELLVFLHQVEEMFSLMERSAGVEFSARFSEIKIRVGTFITLPKLRLRLSQSVAPDGSILSTASPELRSARDRAEHAKKQVISSVENLLQKSSVRDALQDVMWVQRDGRIVLPVRVERRGDVDGIPRGVSGSGSTVFIEPREIAALQALLERALADVEIEEARVLNSLSMEAAAEFEVLEANREAILALDELVARARMASILQASCPNFLDPEKSAARFRFARASHPLFLLEGKPCVPNDLALEPQYETDSPKNVWVLTGPNAGGKTVAMRTVGMAVLMAKAGLFVCAEKAEMLDFENVFVEIGDRQSREEDLSTFSGHLLHVSRMFSHANSRSLILLDEGFVGTDPAVGMALARAALENLCARGVTTLITTHFSNLKMLANENPGFLNASMEFEPRELRPTYRLVNGIPGQSFALELAERIAFPQEILSLARNYYGDESQRVELLLAELQEKRSEIHELVEQHFRELEKLKAERALAEAEKNRILREREELVQSYRSRLTRRLNAFENRLMVRERQFERAKDAAAKEGAASDAAIEDPAIKDASQVAFEQPQQVFSESVPERKEKQSFTSLSELKNVSLAASNSPSPSSQGKSSVDAAAEKFRAPRHMNTRSLLDEARSSLENLDKDFSRIEGDFKKEMGSLAGTVKQHAKSPLPKAISLEPHALTMSPTPSVRPASYWSRGMRVKTSRFREVGTVLRAADSKGLVECEFGAIRLRLPHAELKTIDEAALEYAPKHEKKPKSKQSISLCRRGVNMEIEGVLPHSGNTVDVRGRTGDEGVRLAERFLDRAMRSGEQHIVILHGHGEGKVKHAVRSWLTTAGYAVSFRPGRQGEGGDGVTVVQIEG